MNIDIEKIITEIQAEKLDPETAADIEHKFFRQHINLALDLAVTIIRKNVSEAKNANLQQR